MTSIKTNLIAKTTKKGHSNIFVQIIIHSATSVFFFIWDKRNKDNLLLVT